MDTFLKFVPIVGQIAQICDIIGGTRRNDGGGAASAPSAGQSVAEIAALQAKIDAFDKKLIAERQQKAETMKQIEAERLEREKNFKAELAGIKADNEAERAAIQAKIDAVQKERDQEQRRFQEDQRRERQAQKARLEERERLYRVEREKDQRKVDRFKLEKENAKKALQEIKDSRKSAAAMDGILQRIFAQAKIAGQAKEPRPALIVLGPTSSGKSTLLNKLFGLNLKTGVGAVTKNCRAKAMWRGLVIYDVFGNNDQEPYLQWEAVEQIVGKHVALVCFENAPEAAMNATKLCVNASMKTIMVWTKADRIDEDERAGAEADAKAKAAEYGAHGSLLVSAKKDSASVTKLRSIIDRIRKSHFAGEKLDPDSFPELEILEQ